jgi:hypothetical protein
MTADYAYTITSGLSSPQDLWLDSAGDIYVADNGGETVQEITAGSSGAPSAVAADNGWALDDAGDGGPALQAALNNAAARRRSPP